MNESSLHHTTPHRWTNNSFFLSSFLNPITSLKKLKLNDDPWVCVKIYSINKYKVRTQQNNTPYYVCRIWLAWLDSTVLLSVARVSNHTYVRARHEIIYACDALWLLFCLLLQSSPKSTWNNSSAVENWNYNGKTPPPPASSHHHHWSSSSFVPFHCLVWVWEDHDDEFVMLVLISHWMLSVWRDNPSL